MIPNMSWIMYICSCWAAAKAFMDVFHLIHLRTITGHRWPNRLMSNKSQQYMQHNFTISKVGASTIFNIGSCATDSWRNTFTYYLEFTEIESNDNSRKDKLGWKAAVWASKCTSRSPKIKKLNTCLKERT